jgi:hypothetical protein
MADDFERGGSKLYAALSRSLADDPIVPAIVGEHKPLWEAPLRLFGGVHYLELSGIVQHPWPKLRGVLEANRDWLARFVAEHPVQTNEVQRCWGLLPAFLTVADGRAVDLVELGPSAGLNLFWDTYRYQYESSKWGPPDAEIVLEGTVVAPPPVELFGREIEVRTRLGIDQAPVDLADETQVLLLQAFVWADHRERLERLRRAIDRVRRRPPEIVCGDYVRLLPEVLSRRDPGRFALIFNSATLSYLPDQERTRLEATIEEAGSRGPLAWVSYEFARQDQPLGERFEEAFTVEVRTWPKGERRVLARSDGHGNRLRWVA